MLRTILVPLDGSEFGEAALPTASAIAERTQAALHLARVHVPVYSAYIEGVAILDPELDAASRANEDAYLQAVQRQLTAEGRPAPIAAALDGPVVPTLDDYAAAIHADLVVMTTHGRSGLARFWLGSVADGIVRHSHVPVLLIHPSIVSNAPVSMPPQPLRKVCVALDGSPLAEQMLGPALALGAVFDAEYLLVRVVDSLVVASAPFMPDLAHHEATMRAQRLAEVEHYLEAIAAPLRAEGYRIATRALVDPQPALAILRESREQASDLIALATHGRGGVRRLLLGSVADKILRGADRPVLIYRPKAQPKQGREAGP